MKSMADEKDWKSKSWTTWKNTAQHGSRYKWQPISTCHIDEKRFEPYCNIFEPNKRRTHAQQEQARSMIKAHSSQYNSVECARLLPSTKYVLAWMCWLRELANVHVGAFFTGMPFSIQFTFLFRIPVRVAVDIWLHYNCSRKKRKKYKKKDHNMSDTYIEEREREKIQS